MSPAGCNHLLNRNQLRAYALENAASYHILYYLIEASVFAENALEKIHSWRNVTLNLCTTFIHDDIGHYVAVAHVLYDATS